MVNVDLAISVGIWVAGVGMSAVGIEMTINPPTPRTKWLYRGGFIVMGLAFVGLSIWQSDRADSENKRVSREHQEEQIRNEGNIKFVQGQLQSIQLIMGNLSNAGWPGMKEMAATVAQILRQNQQATQLTNKQLCDRAFSLSQKIKEFEAKFKSEERLSTDKFMAIPPSAMTQEERRAKWIQHNQEDAQRYQEHQAQFMAQFFADAKYLKDSMLIRVSLEKRDELAKNNSQAEAVLSTSLWAGASNEYMIANYLEEIAKTLCPVQVGH